MSYESSSEQAVHVQCQLQDIQGKENYGDCRKDPWLPRAKGREG